MKKTLTFIGGSLIASTLMLGGVAFAQTTPAPSGQGVHGGWGMHGGAYRMPGVFGTVSNISGTSITLASKGFGPNASATTYSVDASNATVLKDGATSTISAIVSGDTLMVQGTVSGTSVTATMIRDGMPRGMHGNRMGAQAAANLPQGNGQPVIGGAVTAINGNSLTVTNTSNVTYAVDGTSATVTKDNAASSIGNIAIGDNVIVQGAVNGTAVTASSILDQGTAPSGSGAEGGAGGHFGFFGAIGGFFHRLFGFF